MTQGGVIKKYGEQKVRQRDLDPLHQRVNAMEQEMYQMAAAVKALAAASGYAVVKQNGVPRIVKSDCIIGDERHNDTL